MFNYFEPLCELNFNCRFIFTFESKHDLNELIHQNREYCHTDNFNEYTDDLLHDGTWVVITVADCRQRCKTEVHQFYDCNYDVTRGFVISGFIGFLKQSTANC